MKRLFISASLFCALLANAQTQAPAQRPDNWFNLDPTNDKVNGVSTERTYQDLLKDRKPTTVIVGVLDSGVDYMHEDLQAVMWTNPGEIPGNGIDDDKNGYIDDIHGWNFIGGKDGKNVDKDNLELTRVYKYLKAKYAGKTEADLKTKDEKKEFKYFQEVKADYEHEKEESESQYNQISFIKTALEDLFADVKKQVGVTSIDMDALKKYEPKEKKYQQGLLIAKSILSSGEVKDIEDLMEQLNEAEKELKTSMDSRLSLDFDPRPIVGDDYNNSSERYYGNADCKGPNSFHGTHVAGIIAAARNNGVGINGIAGDVRIMSVRCVPDGDERDKDVANAIRYAVDNGATIINMSFGKKYSWDKKAVDEAVKYAESKGVLLIHAAGNESLNIDSVTHYPCRRFEDSKKEASNFMVIGALSWKPGDKMVAPFSNYGKKSVDLFSPGVDIYSTVPEGKYKDASGTSMASPVVAGVAAVLKSYFPELTPKQIRKILMKSAITDDKNAKVIKPGTSDVLVKFGDLSITGGKVNLYEAVKMAQTMVKVKG